MSLAVLLRNCPHDTNATGSVLSGNVPTAIYRTRYALKCETFTVQIAKTPIQVPIPQQAPELIDIGFYRPSISISGIVDTVGGDTSNWAVGGHENMERIVVTRKRWHDSDTYADQANNYYIPYKNALEDAVYRWITTEDIQLEMEVGDADWPRFSKTSEPNAHSGAANSADKAYYLDAYHNSDLGSGETNPEVSADKHKYETGGAIYVVAVQQARFQVDPATEDRWSFQMQFVAESRKDVVF